METPQKRRGLISRTAARFLPAPLRTAALTVIAGAILLTPAAVGAAPSAASFAGIDSVDAAKAYFHVDGHNLPSTQYRAIPQTVAGKESVKPDQLKVVICASTGANGSGQCTQNSSDAQVFTFARMHFEDLGGGADYWDYSFVAPGNSKLRFLYRKNPSQSSHWGLVYGDTDQNVEFTENFVAGLEGFGDTDLAKNILENEADREGLAWAKRGGIETSTNQSGFLDRSDSDPFMKAVEKAVEAINSLNESVSNALLWAMETSNPNEVTGLAEAWRTIRDLVNILFMVILAALAIVTIVRLDTKRYNVRSLLPLLIFAIITVNFSFLFATVIVNTAYIVSQPFLTAAREIVEHAGLLGSSSAATADSFGDAFVMLLAALILLIALIILLVFFIVRIIMVWLLTATSPIIFLAMVLPLTRGEASKMMTQWVRWVYMAPIAFVVLYIGSRVGLPNPGQDEATDGLLTAIFYGGLVIAAAMIPMALGGGLMRTVANRGAGAGKVGGKVGLGAAGLLPTGGGKTVGQRVREAKAFVRQRGESQEQDAALAAAHTRIALAENFNRLGPAAQGLSRSITGMSQGQQVAALDAMVTQARKEMTPLSIGSKNRIAQAYKYGTRQVNGRTYANTANGDYLRSGPMDDKELALAGNRINAAAAFRELAEAEYVDEHMMQGPRNFAWTGYQQLHKTDPVVSSYERSGNRINFGSLDVKSQLMDAETLRGLDGNVLQGALDGDQRYLRVLRNMDGVRLAEASDATARNKFHSAAKQRMVYDLAQRGALSGSVNRADFDSDADYHSEVAKQRSTEAAVVKKYTAGRNAMGLPLDHPSE